jgi:transposase
MTFFPTLAVEVLRMVIFEVQMSIEQQLKDLEKRRKRGMRLLADGLWPAEIARRVGVTRKSVLRWTKLKGKGGMEALKRPERFGRPRKLNVKGAYASRMATWEEWRDILSGAAG